MAKLAEVGDIVVGSHRHWIGTVIGSTRRSITIKWPSCTIRHVYGKEVKNLSSFGASVIAKHAEVIRYYINLLD